MAGTATYYLDPASPFSKDVWAAGATEQFEDTPGLLFNMLDQIEPDRVQGRNYFFKLDIGDSLGQGMVTPQGGAFPEAEDPEWSEAKITLARLAHTASLTMDEWELLNSDAAAAVNVVASKIEKATKKMTRELARQTHGDGTGILARCDATTASTTVNLQTDPTNQYDRDRLNWLVARRVLVDIVDATTGAPITNGTKRRVVAVSGSTITLDSAGGNVTTTTNHRITWAGSVSDFSAGTYVSGEVVGLGQLMKRQRTFMGLNSSVVGNDYWDPIVVYGSSPGTPEAFSLGRLQSLYVRMARTATDGMQPSPQSGHTLFSSHGVAAHAMATLANKIQYMNPGTHESRADFGFQEIEGLGLRWFTDAHYANNVLDCLKIQGETGLRFARPMNPMQGLLDFVTTGSGDMWHLQNNPSGTGHKAAMNAYLTGQFGFVCLKPSDHGRLDDVTSVS